MIKNLPPLFANHERPQLVEFQGELSGASVAFFYFVDFHSSTHFQKEKLQPFLNPKSFTFPDKIDRLIWDDYYIGKQLMFRGELHSKAFEYSSPSGHILQGNLRFFLSMYDSMVGCIQVVLPLHSSAIKSNKPIDIDNLIELLNLNNLETTPMKFKLDGRETTFDVACRNLADQLAGALNANPNEVKYYLDDYNCVWLFDADRNCESGDDFARKYAYACSGILTVDKDWRKQNTSEVLENINNDVGTANTYITICEHVLLAISSRWDMESSWERFQQYGCDPALLRAQEYTYYHRILLEKANARIPKVEDILQLVQSGDVEAGKLRKILELRLRMVRDLNERWNPYVFERGQETRIIELFFEMQGMDAEYKLANDRLSNMGDTLREYYQIGQNEHLKKNQEQLLKIQKTNLISQLQIEEISRFSQQNRNAISLIGFVVILSLLFEVIANVLRFLKETQQLNLETFVKYLPFYTANPFINFVAVCLAGVVGAYLVYIIVGMIRQIKQNLQYKAMRNRIEQKAAFYAVDDDLRRLIEDGKTEEASKYLSKIEEEVRKYEKILRQTKALKEEHRIPL